MLGRTSIAGAALLFAASIAALDAGPATAFFDRQAAGTTPSSNTAPTVRIVRPDDSRPLRWGGQFRYAITVADKEDGDSAFGEIAAPGVLLEVAYGPAGVNASPDSPAEPPGLTVLRQSACLNCHADKTSLVGPSFAAIAEKYEDNAETIARLGRHIQTGSSGNWGSLPMPPHAHLSERETQDIARFILDQGRNRHRWLYSGFEGVIRIIDKPDGVESGLYTLTASYLDKGIEDAADTRKRGEHSIVLRIE